MCDTDTIVLVENENIISINLINLL